MSSSRISPGGGVGEKLGEQESAVQPTEQYQGGILNYGDSRLTGGPCACGRPKPKGKRKCASCLSTKGFKVVQGKDSNRGRHARGTTLTRPDRPRTKRAKRQNSEVLGSTPYLRTSEWPTGG